MASQDIIANQESLQYGHITVNGAGLTVNGNVYNNGTLFQPQPEPDATITFGLCLGSAPQMDAAYFVGHAAEIDEMSRILQPAMPCRKQRRLVLGGMGGVGKTQLAIAYAERHQQSYDSVFWLNATSKLTLHADLRLVAGLRLPAQELERLDDEQVLARVHEWLSNPRHSRWLLIFDNYDEPAQFPISKYCPYAAHGSIIVTTRLPDYVHFGSDPIRVQPLSDIEESLDILQRRSHRQNVRLGELSVYRVL